MHDPMTVAFEIKRPWRSEPPSKAWPKGYRKSFITIWHEDPERDGSDDSCAWFKRAKHGVPEVRRKIEGTFAFEWDASYGGWFNTDGSPRFSSSAITLGMFWVAALYHFESDTKKTRRFMRRHLFDILHFAENPTDSLHPFTTSKHGTRPRDERIAEAAAIVYGCVLRWSQPWWGHPRWHVHHWRIQVHPWQQLRRRFWDRCCKCGKRGFPKGVSAIGDWNGERIWHSTCDEARGATVANAPLTTQAN